MARKFAQVSVMLWGRDSFRSLSVEAQRLYLLLSTSPTTTLAGTSDWRPKRLVSLSTNASEDDLIASLDELEAAGMIEVDTDTEEVWLRPMIADDGLLRGPKTVAGLVAAWAVTGSTKLRGAIAAHVRELVPATASIQVRSMLEPLLSYNVEPAPKPKVVPVPPERSKPAPSANRFDEFWAAYPRKGGKDGARRKYDIAVKRGVAEQTIIDGAIKYGVVRHGQDEKYTKLPATWLHNGCWDDEMEEPVYDPYNPENAWG